MERTFSIIKPDAVKRNLTGKINGMLEEAGFRIIAQKRMLMTRANAEYFYGEHKERPFFKDLVDFITSGPVVVQVLQKKNAIADYRDIMGATDPAKADEGTIRKLYGISLDEGNAVHGSDSPESAKREIACFFAEIEICE